MIRPWKGPDRTHAWCDALDERFFAEAFERNPVVLRRAYAGDLAHVLTLADLEHLLICPPGAKSSDVRLSRVAPDGRVDAQAMPPDFKLATVLQRYRAGYSVMLDQINYRWPPIYAMCAALQERLARMAPAAVRSRATCSAFLTPPHAQGHPRHYDRDDAYALQVEGTKTWRFWAPVREAPLNNSSTDGVDLSDLGAPAYELTLEAGDVLYFPRGWVHEPVTGAAHSLHVSFGVIALNWSQLFAEMIASQPACRRSIPKVFLTEDGEAGLREALGAMLASLDDPDDVRRRLRLATMSYLVGENQTAAGLLPDAVSGTADTAERRDDAVFAKRYGARFHLEPAGDRLSIAFPGNVVHVPRGCAAAVSCILEAQTFTAADVRAELTDHDLGELLAQLLESGFLRVTGEDDAEA